jgi:hypothetical protein
MKTLLTAVAFGFVLLLSPPVSQAAEFGKALGIMSANLPAGADTAGMGNCWVAMPGYSSNNPATIAAGEPFRVSGSVNYSATFFKKGPTVHTYETSAYVAMPFGGVVQLTLGNSQSGFGKTRMDGDSIRFDHQPYFDIAYGAKVKENLLREGDKLFVGVGGGMNWFKMSFASGGQNNFVSRSRGVNLYCGALYQPTESLNFGVLYSWSRDWCEDRDIENKKSFRYAADTHQTRIGASWRVFPKFGTTLAVDVQHLNLGSANRVQVFAGVEQQVIKDRLYVYGGWAGSGPTAGVGLYFKNGGVNVAYIHNPHSDMNQYLGRANTVMATVFFKW